MQIKTLQIENFQSHAKTNIAPAPPGQLTIITGPSDSGKTAIIRALRWLYFNTPQGADFLRAGCSMVKVNLEMDSGHRVVRERTKATNRYVVVPPGGERQVFEGFGSGVPLEVQEVTGVGPVQIGDLNINLNLAEQLDGPFLGKSVSGGARAKVLGKLAGTEEIDYAAKLLGTDLYRRNQDEKRMSGELAELEEKIRGYDWLPGMARKIEQLEQLVKKLRTSQERRGRMVQLKEQLEQVDEKIIACQAVLCRWRNLEQTEQLAIDATENQSNKETLVKLINDYWTCQKNMSACEKIIKQYAGLPKAEEKLQSAQDTSERVKRLRNLKASYLFAQDLIQKNQEILCRLRGIDQAGELVGGMRDKITRRDILLRPKRSFEKIGMFITQEQAKVETLQRVAEAENLLRAAGEKRRQWEKLAALWDKFISFNTLIENTRGKTVMWENRVAELQGAYQDELITAGICPLCGQVIDYQKIKEAV